jgi:hypothetical protein
MQSIHPPIERAAALADAIVARLDTGGATDIRATSHPVWIIGRAPGGGVFELFDSLAHGYCVMRLLQNGESAQHLGFFLAWTDAVDHALLA